MAVGLYVHVDVIVFRFLLHPFDALCSQCPGAAENAHLSPGAYRCRPCRSQSAQLRDLHCGPICGCRILP